MKSIVFMGTPEFSVPILQALNEKYDIKAVVTHADRLHVRLDELHRVVNAQTGVNRSARAIDVERNILVGIFTFKEQQLGNHEICRFVVDFARQEHDAVAQQTRINIEAAFTAAALFDHHRDQCVLNVVHDLIFRLLELRLTGRAVKKFNASVTLKALRSRRNKNGKKPVEANASSVAFSRFRVPDRPLVRLDCRCLGACRRRSVR